MTTLPIAEWAPDMPDLAEATSVIQNAYPLTAESYGPVNALVNISSNALNNTPLGMFSVQDFNLAVSRFGGTVDKLYIDTNNSWSDVTRTASPYSTNAGENWRFAVFEEMVFAVNFSDAMQVYTLGSSTNFQDANLAAPQGRFICVAKQFLVVGNVHHSGDNFSNRLWWSSFGDPTAWPTPGSAGAQQTMSDFEDIPGNPGPITGLAASLSGCDMAIFFARGVWRAFFVGPPDVFDFYPAQAALGTVFSNSLVTDGGQVYYVGSDGFASFDGAQMQRIGDQKVDRWFFGAYNKAFPQNVIGANDVANKRILWAFPSAASFTGKPDTIICFHKPTGRWGLGLLSLDWLTAYLPIVAGNPPSNTSLGAITVGKLASFTGSTLPATMSTKMVQPTPGRRTFVQSTRPLLEVGASSPAVSITLRSRVNYNDQDTIGPAISPNTAGECPQRVDARYFRGDINIGVAQAWSHCLGAEVTQSIPGGFR